MFGPFGAEIDEFTSSQSTSIQSQLTNQRRGRLTNFTISEFRRSGFRLSRVRRPGLQALVFERDTHGEVVQALKLVVGESQEFVDGIVEIATDAR